MPIDGTDDRVQKMIRRAYQYKSDRVGADEDKQLYQPPPEHKSQEELFYKSIFIPIIEFFEENVLDSADEPLQILDAPASTLDPIPNDDPPIA